MDVLAAHAGIVVHAGDSGDGFGLSIIIARPRTEGEIKFNDHFGHLKEILVAEGDAVNAGEVIART